MHKLAQALACHAAAAGLQIAMSDGRRSLTRSALAAWVAGIAQDLGPAPETVGISGSNSVEWAVAFLAASVAGKTIVPVPAFFSEGQRDHLIRDAGVSRVIVTDAESPQAKLDGTCRLKELHADEFPVQDGGGLIIYTSGSTGNPKGVRLLSSQALERGDLGEGHRRQQRRQISICTAFAAAPGADLRHRHPGSRRGRFTTTAPRRKALGLARRATSLKPSSDTAHDQRSCPPASGTLRGAIDGLG